MKPILLPCGTPAVVSEFNGRAQDLLLDEELTKKGEQFDLVLAQVVNSLGDKPPSAQALLDLSSGSRLRLMIEARALTYGDEVKLDLQCLGCGEAWDDVAKLSDVDDVLYPVAEASYRTASGLAVTIGWGTGHTEKAYVRGVPRKLWGKMDEPLTRIKTVNGEPKGPLYFQQLGGAVLDELRMAVRSMTPVKLLPERAHEDQPNVARGLPQGGPRHRWQVECPNPKCRRRGFAYLEAQKDFLFHGALKSADS
jgi:hypothetical protein